ncbi:MAG: hypothetical protein U5L02_06260 [Rheinheimera sp.]|nr:hypothetical protein [Rheinheimera sp.]
MSIINQNEIITETLIGAGADCNSVSNDTVSILQEASAKSNIKIINMVIGCGANVNAKNKYGLSALHFAANNKNNEAIEALLNAGADKQALYDIAKLEEQNRLAQANNTAASNSDDSWIAYMIVGLMNVAANVAYPNTTYTPAPAPHNPLQPHKVTNVSSQQPQKVLVTTPSGCNSDFECGPGKQCVKGPLQGQGQCLTPVNQYGLPKPGVMPDPNSIKINTNLKGACEFDTQCGVGFRCDQTLKVCVQ